MQAPSCHPRGRNAPVASHHKPLMSRCLSLAHRAPWRCPVHPSLCPSNKPSKLSKLCCGSPRLALGVLLTFCLLGFAHTWQICALHRSLLPLDLSVGQSSLFCLASWPAAPPANDPWPTWLMQSSELRVRGVLQQTGLSYLFRRVSWCCPQTDSCAETPPVSWRNGCLLIAPHPPFLPLRISPRRFPHLVLISCGWTQLKLHSAGSRLWPRHPFPPPFPGALFRPHPDPEIPLLSN